MKRLLVLTIGAWCVLGVCSCEWESSGDEDSWSGRYNWINFSGVYTAPEGRRYVVQSFDILDPADPDAAEPISEAIGQGDDVNASFGATLSRTPVVFGSVTVSDGVETFTDPTGSGVLTGDGGGTGSVNYETGAIQVNFFVPPDPGTITATYLYLVAPDPVVPRPGSGTPIHSLNVSQMGNKIVITDNNGVQYPGQFGRVSTAGGGDSASSGQLIANFEATGPTGIQLVGNFSGVYISGTDDSPGTLTGRQIQGTWIEPGGPTGDILGAAGDVEIDPGLIGGEDVAAEEAEQPAEEEVAAE